MANLPVDPEMMRRLEHTARGLFDMMDEFAKGDFSKRRVGMALFLFGFGTGEMTYISNSNREDMVKMLMEFIAKNPPAMTWDQQHG